MFELTGVRSGMIDTLSAERRSLLMGRVRQHGTAVELLLRKALWSAGLRYRLQTAKRLPGRPDIVFVGPKVAVFVDGCFWHGCPMHGTKPKTNEEFWLNKIRRNRERDAEVDAKLVGSGWRVIRLWEHEVRGNVTSCVRQISDALQAAPR